MSTVRLLGAAQPTVFVASMLSERLLATAAGTGHISEILANISGNVTMMRLGSLVALVDSLAIITLGALFYTVFHSQYEVIALVALGCFLAEAITLAVSKIGTYALIPLSQEFVAAGAQDASRFQALGSALHFGVDRRGYDLHMLFFCLGAILWYALLVKSGVIPQFVSVWGLVAVCLLTIPTLLALVEVELMPEMILALPYAPFELVLSVWLMVKGFS